MLKTRRVSMFIGGLLVLTVVAAACAQDSPDVTPSLRPTRTTLGTPTPIAEELAKQRVRQVFDFQVAAIQRDDWHAVYETCSPEFRAAREVERFVKDASAQFARDGYSSDGFDARNVQPFVRSSDRVRVRWDAYQDGRFIRTEEVGMTYVFTHGDWYDDGAWCR